MLKIGLTGGIGSGKTAVSTRFEQLGIPVIDTDIIARELVDGDASTLAKIKQIFGPEVINRNGRLDRQKLAQKIFSNHPAREKLEQILHPKIRKVVDRRLRLLATQSAAPYVVIVVPLLLETDFKALVDRILVVLADTDKRIERIRKRDNRTLDEIRSIIASQASDDIRRKAANDIIENNNDINNLKAQVKTLHNRYLALSGTDS